MLELINHTPLTAAAIPGLDKHGTDYLAVVMKGRFKITPGQTKLTFNEEPAPIVQADVHYGEPDKTSVRYESDAVPRKLSTDVVVNGHAYVPNQGQAYSVDVSISVDKQTKTCRVYGDRVWEKSRKAVMSWEPSQPQPFERMPMLYERAFGGVDQSQPDNPAPEYCERNPVGRGFIGNRGAPEEGMPLPNIEDPRQLIQQYQDRPMPAGFGFIGRAWQPRVVLAGSYDEAWQKTRLPLLPHDFDERYFNGAHPDLITPNMLRGGERIMLQNLSPHGNLAFDLPSWQEQVVIFIKGNKTPIQPALDTVVIEPDENTVLVTWRATLPCHRQFLYIDTIIIGKKRQV